MKILITGGTGQLGRDCVRVLEKNHDVIPLDLDVLDISDGGAVAACVLRLHPDVIINCAAFTQVDECETKRALARKVNVAGPRYLAAAAALRGLPMIHISTDYVFDGKKPVPQHYTETDRPQPGSYYGVTKLEGERAVMEETDRYAILRTAWLYGIHGQNFLKTMLKLALQDARKEVKVVNDQFGSPTWSYRLAEQIETVMIENANGIFHATSEGFCSWYDLATTFLNEMEIPHAFVPCTTREYPTPAKRPTNSILENRRLKEEGLNLMGDWRTDLVRFVNSFKDRLIREVT